MIVTVGEQQSSGIISVSCRQLTQDYFFKQFSIVFFILTEKFAALRNIHRIVIQTLNTSNKIWRVI